MPYLLHLYEMARDLRASGEWLGLLAALGAAIELGVATPVALGVHLLAFGVAGDVVARVVCAAAQDEQRTREAA